MKKLLFITISLFFAFTLSAQTSFSVPEISETQKKQHLSFLFKYDVIIGIGFAKSAGKTVEEYAMYSGNIHKLTWKKETTFDEYIKDIIFNMAVISEKVEIINQSAEKVTLKATNLYNYLKNNGSVNNVSYKEYIAYFDIVLTRIADYIGYSGSIEIAEDGILITLKK